MLDDCIASAAERLVHAYSALNRQLYSILVGPGSVQACLLRGGLAFARLPAALANPHRLSSHLIDLFTGMWLHGKTLRTRKKREQLGAQAARGSEGLLHSNTSWPDTWRTSLG